VGERAAQDFAGQHSGQIDIRDKFRVAGDFVETFDPLHAPADDGEFFCLCHDDILFDLLEQNGL
jgi:hypothetical protein